MELLSYILNFLKNPKREIRSEKPISEKLKDVILIFLCTFTVVIVIIAPLMYSMLDLENIPNKLQDLSDHISDLHFFLLGVVAAPLLEEFFFRFPLKYRKGVLFLLVAFLAGLVYFLASRFFTENQVMSLTAVFFFSYGALLIVNDAPLTESKLGKLFPYVFYITAAMFGLAHVSNYEIDPSLWYMFPVLVLPQLFLGLMLGFVRLRYGLWAAIMMHAMNNFLPFMVMLFAPDM